MAAIPSKRFDVPARFRDIAGIDIQPMHQETVTGTERVGQPPVTAPHMHNQAPPDADRFENLLRRLRSTESWSAGNEKNGKSSCPSPVKLPAEVNYL